MAARTGFPRCDDITRLSCRLSLRWFEPSTCHLTKPQFILGFRFCDRLSGGAVRLNTGDVPRWDPGHGRVTVQVVMTCRNEFQ